MRASEHPVWLMGIPISDVSPHQLVNTIQLAIQKRQRMIVANVNIHAMNQIYRRPALYTFFGKQADIVFCDGFGVKVAGRLVGTRITHRLTPPDWIDELCARCAESHFSLYLLGAREGVADRAGQYLMSQHPGLRVVGTHHGFFDKSLHHPENQQVLQDIRAAQPDILLVAFGMPLQELWLMENWGHLDARVAVTVGALFNYLAGELRRPPHWMTDNGLEWLGRLFVEPRRLWRRYIFGIPCFFWRLFKYTLSIMPDHLRQGGES